MKEKTAYAIGMGLGFEIKEQLEFDNAVVLRLTMKTYKDSGGNISGLRAGLS